MKTNVNLIQKLFILMSLNIIISSSLFAQTKIDVRVTREKAPVRNPVELMNVITANIMGTYPLVEGDFKHGDWADVKKSKPPRTLYW